MPRKRNWPPVPRPHKASGQERVRYGDREYYLGPIGSPEARAAYAALLAKLAAGGAPEPARARKRGLTVAELAERWDDYARRRYDPEGREADEYALALRGLLALFAARPACEIGARELDDAREAMIAAGWCRRVINRRVGRLRTVWRWAEQRGLVPEGRWAALRALAPLGGGDHRVKEHPPRQAAEWVTLVRVVRRCPATIRDMVLVQWFTGARSAEVRQMRAGQIDRAGEIWVYTPARHKCAWRGQGRSLALGPRAQAVLRRRLEGLGPQEYVFPSGPGTCYTRSSYPQAVRRAARKAGVGNFHPYLTRHAARLRATQATDLEGARAFLGHVSLQTTNGYARGIDAAAARDVARKIG